MSLALDLLEQAQHLSRREPRRPRQASLRRAVPAAYYALFHLLIGEATTLLISRPELRPRFARAFEHGDMKNASRRFINPRQPDLAALTGGATVPQELQDVAEAFVTLQEARHEADYGMDRAFTRLDTTDLVGQAAQAFANWQAVRSDPVARTYLAALLLWKKWSR